MTLWLRGHGYRFEMENICRLFLPQEKIRAVEERPEETEGVTAETGLDRGETATRIVCRISCLCGCSGTPRRGGLSPA